MEIVCESWSPLSSSPLTKKKRKEAGGKWIVKPSPKVLASEEKAAICCPQARRWERNTGHQITSKNLDHSSGHDSSQQQNNKHQNQYPQQFFIYIWSKRLRKVGIWECLCLKSKQLTKSKQFTKSQVKVRLSLLSYTKPNVLEFIDVPLYLNTATCISRF